MVRINGKMGKIGYIDTKGNFVIPATYDNGTSFHEGIASVLTENEKWLLIDASGKRAVQHDIKSATLFREGLAPVVEKKKVGYIDKAGKMVIKPEFEAGSLFAEGLAPVKVGDKCGYINKKGKMVIKPEFDWDQRLIDQFVAFYSSLK